MADLSRLFENKLFASFLSGGGAALQRGDPLSAGLDPITQQSIGAQSKAGLQARYMKELARLLRSGVDFKSGADGTASVTDGTKKISGTLSDVLGGSELGSSELEPIGDLSDLLKGFGLDSTILSPGSDIARPPEPVTSTQLGGLNPFASSLPSGADLAGLTAQDVSQALQDAVGVESLRSNIAGKGIDRRYKEALIRQADRAGIPKADPLDQPFMTGVPGFANMTLRRYKGLSTDDKEFVSHNVAAKALGKEPMSRLKFDARDEEDIETTAMATAIAGYVEETGKRPTPELMAQWATLFKGDPTPKTPSLMTWNQASSKLQERFGKLDPTGKWAVTEDLQRTHRKAQEFLEENRSKGNMHPLEAINNAETRARNWVANEEERYHEYIRLTLADQRLSRQQREARIEAIKSRFFATHKYLPTGGD